ncbi:LPS export ABC transporter periplasmic protein LptC [Thiomicrorhabdus chilensis]|uniref:LPS export ABC transporter periplasmic protein LptC n=1 Tax=Thiomicrorhabdus chilensis TaxID=63656 RepID=UPI0004100E73|nr:LPS export ABC transporter periplasmic protein LptC [Thiomicrorhabdus chilensis]
MFSGRFILFALILAALALWISFQQTTQQSALLDSSLKSTDYSWQLFNSTTWQFDKTQSKQNTITQADSVFYQEANQTSQLSQPRIVISQPEQTLVIRSQQGKTRADSVLELAGQVIITQFDQPYLTIKTDSQNKTLTTEFITYNSNTEEINSHREVVITQANGTTSGTGLQANLQTRQFQLLSNVKGHYMPSTEN